jgi:uncharacterized protein (DUF58 family)
MVNKGRFEKTFWMSLLELSLVILGFLLLLPTAFLVAFLILVYFMVGSALTSSDLSKLSFRRMVAKDRISDEDELIIDEILRNESPKPVSLEVLSPLPQELLVSEGSNHYLVHLESKETRRIRYKIKPSYHGNFTIQKATVRTLDYLVSPYEEVEKESKVTFSVYPVLEELRKFPFSRMSVRPLQGVIPSKSPGHGTEFFEIRDYSPTDEFRRINWKASARSRTLLSNEYESERLTDIFMILDSTSSSIYFLKDYVRACLSLSDFFLRMGNRVGLVIIGKFWTWVRAGSGRRQLVRIAESILEERPEDPLDSTYPVESTLRAVPRVSTIMLLSPVRNEIVRVAVRRMVDRKQRIIAMIPTSTASSLKPAESDPLLVAVAKNLVLLQRENALKFLQTFNVPTMEWDPKSPISKTLEVLERWTSRDPIASLQIR